MSALASIVAGRFHVWASDREIIRSEWHGRFKTKWWRHHEQRKVRHDFIREVLKVHHANQDLCVRFGL